SVDKGCALFDFHIGELAQGKVLTVRCRQQKVLDRGFVTPEFLLQSDDKIELPLPLNHLRGRLPAQGRVDQGVDVADIQPVACDLLAVRRDDETRLSKFTDNRDFSNAGNL